MKKKSAPQSPPSISTATPNANGLPPSVINFTAFDHLLEGVQVIDFQWKYLYINDTAARQSKCTKEDLIGKVFADAWPGIESSEVFALIKDSLENKNPHKLENRFVFLDKSVGWFELSVQPIPEGVFILSVDITPRKNYEKQLIEKEQRFRHVFETANVGKSMTSLDGTIEVNQAFCDILGYSKDELKNANWKDITPPEDVAEVEKRLTDFLHGPLISSRITKRFIHKDGSYITTDLSTAKHFTPEGEADYFITTIIDITERVAAQKALKEQEQLLRLFIEYSPAAIAMFDRNMCYLAVSKRYIKDYKLDDIDLVGKSHYEVHPDIPDRWKKIHQDCLHGAIRKQQEDSFTRTNGCLVWVRWEIHPWYDQNQEIGGIILFSEVITDLVNARQKAQESDRLKRIFLANMSHEIRTPLNAILGFSNLLVEEEDAPHEEKIDYGSMIRDAGHRLMKIVNDIIDISTLEAGQFQVSLRKEAIYPMLEASFLEFRDIYDAPGKDKLKFYLNLPEELRDSVTLTDKVRFQQVLGNLLSNAIKYTDEGSITLGVKLEGGVKHPCLKVFVTDTGPGIPSDKKHLVFRRFRQIEEDTFHEGSGLGLSIVKGIVRHLGGKTGFTSIPGQGSTFFFTTNIVDDQAKAQSDSSK